MRLRLEATLEELEDKGDDLIKALADRLRPIVPDLSDTLEKAVQLRKEKDLKFKAMRGLQTETAQAYVQTTKAMLADINAVIDERPLAKSGIAENLEKALADIRTEFNRHTNPTTPKPSGPPTYDRYYDAVNYEIPGSVAASLGLTKSPAQSFKALLAKAKADEEAEEFGPVTLEGEQPAKGSLGDAYFRLLEMRLGHERALELTKAKPLAKAEDDEEEAPEPGDVDPESGDVVPDPPTPEEQEEAAEEKELEKAHLDKLMGMGLSDVLLNHNLTIEYPDGQTKTYGPEGRKLDKALITKEQVSKRNKAQLTTDPHHDHTEAIVQADERAYRKVRKELKRYGYSDPDFDAKDGKLYGQSVNQLIELVKEERKA